MKKQIFITLLASVFVWACSSEEPIREKVKVSEITSTGRFLTPDEACAAARQSLVDLGLVSSSRSTGSADVYLYRPSSLSRSSTADSMFYVVNFDEGGFALILADRAAAVNTISISETGTFEENDSPESQAYVRINLPDSILYGPINPKYPYILPSINPDPYYYDEEGYRTEVVTDVFEYSNRINLRWHQLSPYNSLCPYLTREGAEMAEMTGLAAEYNERCTTGCGPIAVAMICSHYKKPEAYCGSILYWDHITSSPEITVLDPYNNAVLRFIAKIGKDMNANYGFQTGTSLRDAERVFRMLGYKNAIFSTDITKCCESLKRGEVVMIRGTDTAHNGQHTWIIDGYKDLRRTYRKYKKGSSSYSVWKVEHSHYFSFNWGSKRQKDRGDDIVYYYAGNPYETQKDNNEDADKTPGQDRVYNTNFAYIVNIN